MEAGQQTCAVMGCCPVSSWQHHTLRQPRAVHSKLVGLTFPTPVTLRYSSTGHSSTGQGG
eukprot:3883901-Rhodomonas_salina.8